MSTSSSSSDFQRDYTAPLKDLSLKILEEGKQGELTETEWKFIETILEGKEPKGVDLESLKNRVELIASQSKHTSRLNTFLEKIGFKTSREKATAFLLEPIRKDLEKAVSIYSPAERKEALEFRKYSEAKIALFGATRKGLPTADELATFIEAEEIYFANPEALVTKKFAGRLFEIAPSSIQDEVRAKLKTNPDWLPQEKTFHFKAMAFNVLKHDKYLNLSNSTTNLLKRALEDEKSLSTAEKVQLKGRLTHALESPLPRLSTALKIVTLASKTLGFRPSQDTIRDLITPTVKQLLEDNYSNFHRLTPADLVENFEALDFSQLNQTKMESFLLSEQIKINFLLNIPNIAITEDFESFRMLISDYLSQIKRDEVFTDEQVEELKNRGIQFYSKDLPEAHKEALLSELNDIQHQYQRIVNKLNSNFGSIYTLGLEERNKILNAEDRFFNAFPIGSIRISSILDAFPTKPIPEKVEKVKNTFLDHDPTTMQKPLDVLTKEGFNPSLIGLSKLDKIASLEDKARRSLADLDNQRSMLINKLEFGENNTSYQALLPAYTTAVEQTERHLSALEKALAPFIANSLGASHYARALATRSYFLEHHVKTAALLGRGVDEGHFFVGQAITNGAQDEAPLFIQEIDSQIKDVRASALLLPFLLKRKAAVMALYSPLVSSSKIITLSALNKRQQRHSILPMRKLKNSLSLPLSKKIIGMPPKL